MIPASKRKDNILVIINPFLERRSGINLLHLLHKYLDHDKFNHDVFYSESPEQIFELVSVKKKEYRIFIAAGGDGTVNNVGRCLIHSENILGIIPLGSGNGFARSLKIPLNPGNAIKTINRLNLSLIDTGMINDTPFMNMAGIGFCAAVAHQYEKSGRHGLFAYLISLLSVLFHYKPKKYVISSGEKTQKVTAFLIAAGNTSQWGYNFHICPRANPADGMLDLLIIKKFPLVVFPFLLCRLFLKNLYRSKYSEMIRIKEAVIGGTGEITGHIDGNPALFPKFLKIKVLPGSLKIITGVAKEYPVFPITG